LTINECCIQSDILNLFGDNKYFDIYLKKQKKYTRIEYIPLCYQDTILTPILEVFQKVSHDRVYRIDFRSAYINNFKDNNLKIPYGIPKILSKYEISVPRLENASLFVVKCRVFLPKNNNTYFPFLPIKYYDNLVKRHRSVLGTCFSCVLRFFKAKRKKKIPKCKHEQNQRSFIICLTKECYIYSKRLGYEIEILEALLYKNSINISSFADFADKFNSYKEYLMDHSQKVFF